MTGHEYYGTSVSVVLSLIGGMIGLLLVWGLFYRGSRWLIGVVFPGGAARVRVRRRVRWTTRLQHLLGLVYFGALFGCYFGLVPIGVTIACMVAVVLIVCALPKPTPDELPTGRWK